MNCLLIEQATRYQLEEVIHETHDGPLSLATDIMIWNVTQEGFTERTAVATEARGVPGTATQPPL